ncbi:MAG TPA: hypothetical protein ENG03_01055 [Thioploca sp.]|nr:hypothetical protein [Thioploca sp.]
MVNDQEYKANLVRKSGIVSQEYKANLVPKSGIVSQEYKANLVPKTRLSFVSGEPCTKKLPKKEYKA